MNTNLPNNELPSADPTRLSSTWIELLNSSPLPMALLDHAKRFLRANPRFLELTGYQLAQLPPFDDFRAQYCPDAPHATLESGSVPLSLSGRDSTAKNLRLHVSAANGLTLLVVVEVTESQRAYETLAGSESRFRAMVECAPAAIRVSRSDHTLYANPAYLKMFGYTSLEDLCARPFLDPYAIASRPALEVLRKRRDRGERDHMEIEVMGKHVDGREFPVRLFLDGARYPDGPVTIALLTDISEQRRADEDKRRLREELIQAQKAEAVGRLAGGIAHDFNNLLTVINGYSSLLLSRLNPETGIYAQVEEIRKAGENAADLTRQLLAFSRKQVLEPHVLNLNDVVRETVTVIERLLPKDIALTCALEADLVNVEADPVQLHQVLMNLALNARDAMPHGGTLLFQTRNASFHMAAAEGGKPAAAGSYALLEVTDSGLGMDQATLDRIFEPFFTTKDMGKGAGLGLASAYGIVKQSGGEIRVSSAPGKGTTVSIHLPAAGKCLAPSPRLDRPAELSGTRTVLVVEDQPAVRRFTVECLRGYGYNVVSAANAEAAIRLCESSNNIIHVLVTDIVMDDMNGLDLAKNILRLRPQIRVLCMSGYADALPALGTSLPAEYAFLQKPFAPAALAQKMRELLGH